MQGLLNDIPAIVALLLVVGFLALTAYRLGIQFLVRRLAGLIFVLLGAVTITFFLNNAAPTDAITGQLGQHYTPEAAARLRHFYGLDLPWYQQYATFLNRLLHFDLGETYTSRGRTVWSILSTRVPISMQLGLSALVIAVLIGVAVGIFAAVRVNTSYDTGVQSLILLFYAIPTFVVIPFYQLAMIQLNNAGIPHLPTSSTDWPRFDEIIAPVVILALVQIALFARLTRTSMLEVLRQDYIRTARAKGLNERIVIWRHAFRTAMIPLLTAVGPALALVINGAFITESLFNIPGIGFTTLSAVEEQDFPVITGTVILLAVAVAIMNLVTDVAYGFADPRIRSE